MKQLTLFGRPITSKKIEEQFNIFAAVYPPRRGSDPRKPALEKFAKLVAVDQIDPQDIIAGARRYADSHPDPNYTCQMTTFLNQHRWEQREYLAPTEAGSMLDISIR